MYIVYICECYNEVYYFLYLICIDLIIKEEKSNRFYDFLVLGYDGFLECDV